MRFTTQSFNHDHERNACAAEIMILRKMDCFFKAVIVVYTKLGDKAMLFKCMLPHSLM